MIYSEAFIYSQLKLTHFMYFDLVIAGYKSNSYYWTTPHGFTEEKNKK